MRNVIRVTTSTSKEDEFSNYDMDVYPGSLKRKMKPYELVTTYKYSVLKY